MNRNNNIKDRERALKELKEFILRYKKEDVSYDEFIKYLDDIYKPEIPRIPEIVEKPEEISILMSVFDNDYLSALEAIVKYLHENKRLRLAGIARLLNRDQRAIGVTYRFARKKMKAMLKTPVSKYLLPLSVIADKKMSVLESIVYYIKKTYSLSYHEVAVLLKRNDRTIWTVHHRALKKL